MAETDAPSFVDYDDDDREWTRPNVVFLMVDDIGQHDLGCYGGDQIPTPNLDRMAAEGTRFTDCYTGTAVCAPSRSVLMTGQHAGHTRVRGNHATVGGAWIDDPDWHGGGRRTVPLQGGDTTVAEVMSAAGYATGCIGKWGLGDLGTGGMPTRQGFDSFYGYLDQVHAHDYFTEYLIRDEEREPIPENRDDGGEWSIGPDGYPAGESEREGVYAHDLLVEESLAFVREHADEDFFCYLPWTLPHGPHVVPELEDFVDEDWTEKEKGYASMVARLDRDVGRLLDALEAAGVDDETVVFFCSDHGPNEPFVDAPLHSSGPLRGFKRQLYEGGIRTPMLVRWPGEVPAGRVDDAPWYYPDVLPTLAELAGLDHPLGDLDVDTDGVSVARTLLGGDQPLDRRYLYWEFPEQGETGLDLAQAARFGDWKAYRAGRGADTELYDLSADAGEERDLADDRPEVVARFERHFADAHEESPHWPTW
jgi:arylsulfatase A-like enzyme